MLNTKKILFTFLIASCAFAPCSFADEQKIENEYSIKTLEKDFKYKNIEHNTFYPSTNSEKGENIQKNKTIIPKIYNIDLNSSSINKNKVTTITYNQNLIRAKEAISKGDVKTGLLLLNQVSDNSPAWVLAEQAGLYEQINQLHLALKTYDKAISKGGDRIELLYNQAACYYKSNNLNKAQKAFEQVLSISPDFMLAYYNLGNIHFKNNNYYKALKCYQKSLELNPLSLDAIYNMGITLEVINEPRLALKYYQKYTYMDAGDKQVKQAIERLQGKLTKVTS